MCKLLQDKNVDKIIKSTIEDMFGVNCLIRIQYNKDLEQSNFNSRNRKST